MCPFSAMDGDDEEFRELDNCEKCFRLCICLTAVAGIVVPLFGLLLLTDGNVLRGGVDCLFPGDNILVTTANAMWGPRLTMTSPTFDKTVATAYHVNADAMSPPRNRLNVPVAFRGDLSIKLTSHEWYYVFYHLNHLTKVNMECCVAENVSGDVLLLVIQGEENLTIWKSTMDAKYSVLQKQISLDCAHKTEYMIANDDTYYFVFYSESAVTVEANLAFQLYLSANPVNSTWSCTPQNSDESCTVFLYPFGDWQFSYHLLIFIWFRSQFR